MRDLKGKRVLVTGATAGIGKETARALAAMGAEVILVGRNLEKTKQVVEEVKRLSGNPQVELLLADLSLVAEVKRLAKDFLARFDRLDVLVNNAGLWNPRREVTKEGHELVFATNHLAYYVLALELLPALQKAGKARIVNVASDAHRLAKGLDFDDLDSAKGYSGFPVYARSKLANILFTRELARRLSGTGVTVNAVHPGPVDSNFMAKTGFWGVMGKLASLFLRSVEKGAETSIYLASAPEVEGVTGDYFADKRPKRPTKYALDDAAARRLWDVSVQLTGVGAA